MSRTYVVTGSASGIGKATAELLQARGEKVIGVDINEATVVADLSTPQGRAEMVRQVTEHSDGKLDGVLAIAGLAAAKPVTVAVNFFGMVGTLEGLRPLLSTSEAPRAVGISSVASTAFPVDDDLVRLMLADDEPGALARAAAIADEDTTSIIYSSTKVAFARWIRQNAATDPWAGAGIALNAIAPGIINTPMVAEATGTEEHRRAMRLHLPMPLNGVAEPVVTARLLAWLTSVENTHLCGQVIFVDGGTDAVIRGDSTW